MRLLRRFDTLLSGTSKMQAAWNQFVLLAVATFISGVIPALFLLTCATFAEGKWFDKQSHEGLPRFSQVRQWLTPSLITLTATLFTAVAITTKATTASVGDPNTVLLLAQIPVAILLCRRAIRFRRLVRWLCVVQGCFAVTGWTVNLVWTILGVTKLV